MIATRAHAVSKAIPASVSIEDIAQFFCTDPSQMDYHSYYGRTILELLLDSVESSQENINKSETVWMAESNYRALSILQLILLLNWFAYHDFKETNSGFITYERARKLADAYQSLNGSDDHKLAPCEVVVHDIIDGLVAVFGVTTNGLVNVEVHTVPLSLDVNRRRALSLLVSELTIEMLKDGAERMSGGHVTLSFVRTGREQMYIRIGTSCPLLRSFSSPGYEIVCALSGVLASEILYSEAETGGTYVELLLPLQSCEY